MRSFLGRLVIALSITFLLTILAKDYMTANAQEPPRYGFRNNNLKANLIYADTLYGNFAMTDDSLYIFLISSAAQDTFWVLPTNSAPDDSGVGLYVDTDGDGTIVLMGNDDDEWHITINTDDQALFVGGTGGYSFDDSLTVIQNGMTVDGLIRSTVGGSIPTWGHSPTGLAVEGISEFDGAVYIDGSIGLLNDTDILIGTSNDVSIRWSRNGDTGGSADEFLRFFINQTDVNSTSMVWMAKDLNPWEMTDHDDYLSPTLVMVNDEGADANDYSYVLLGPRTTADVTAAWYWDIMTGTGAADGAADGTATELGAIFRIGAAGTATTGHSLDAGDVLFEGDIEVDGVAFFDDIPVAVGGVKVGTDDTDHLIDEATNGAGSATLYIGNESILASGDIGVSVLAFQTIGIADDNLVEIDGADIADDEYARFTANGLESRTATEVAVNIGDLFETITADSTSKISHGTPWNLADGEWTGETVIAQAYENLIFGNVCYMFGDGKYIKAQADSAASMPGWAMALGTINADAYGVFLLQGYACEADWTTVQTQGAAVYVDDDTAGLPTTTQPPDTGDQSQKIGYCIGTDIFYFTPDYTLVEQP